MNSSTIRFAVTIFSLFIPTVSCAANTNQVSPALCVERVLKVDVVRVDDRNHRLFIASRQILASDIKNNLIRLEKCFSGTKWLSAWSLSVFTDSKYAGYKDEEKIIPFHNQNMWAKAYVLEYDHANKSLIKNPATNPEHILP